MFYFWDTSALAKRYFDEPGSDLVKTLVEDATHDHAISRLTLAEVSSAIVRRAGATATASDVTSQLARFDADMTRNMQIVSVDDALFDEAVALVRRRRLRGCDSLQLASALRLAQVLRDVDVDPAYAVAFVSADGDLNAAAEAEGLTVVNPNDT